jgi:hypothetical protein
LKAGSVIGLLCLVVCGCGASAHLSEPAFRSKANAICHRFNQRADALDPGTKHGFRAILVEVDQEIAGLARLKPPPRDAEVYADYLKRIRQVATFARLHGRELLALTTELDHAMPRRVSDYGSSRAMAPVRRIERQIVALERPISLDAHAAATDAARLHLPECRIGATGD